jgi:selenide,water dikinase
MMQILPQSRDLVLVGGGHTHALVLRMWGMNPLPGARLTLISPDTTAAYSGMLPGFVAGHYAREALDIDLVRLARFAGARFVQGAASAVDLAEGTVTVAGRPAIGWDVLSLDIGITSCMPLIPGFAAHAVPAKPLDRFALAWEKFLGRVAKGQARPEVAVIGGGVAGVELALAARHSLGPASRVTLIEAREALGAVGAAARARLMRALNASGVALAFGSPAVEILPDAVLLEDGRRIASAFVVGAAAARPHDWLATTGLALHEGFLAVGPTLQSTADPRVFATGDTAHMTETPRPRAGVFAVRQAPVLHHNLVAALAGTGPLRRYRPQGDYLRLISTGTKSAVADKWGLALSGRFVWRWKDRIDRRFMAMFGPLPAMPAPPPPDTVAAGQDGAGDPLCGGCGAKVGEDELSRVLAALPQVARPDVLTGPGEDAALLSLGPVRQVLTTDHLRAITDDPWLMARIAAVHALGDIWATGARTQAALAQIVLPRMTPALQSRTLAEVMAGASEVFAAEGAAIVGGHTSLGAEMTIGFTVTGLGGDSLIGHSGARPGDRLVLTKPLGTGIILAAAMRGLCPGRVVAGALASMARPQGQAAAILARSATAMTDITGFGLARHLLRLLDASGAAARLYLSAVPLLDGALGLSQSGIASTLYASNRAAGTRMRLPEDPRVPLLFDPQTAGGLLAAVPADAADRVLRELAGIGFAGSILGVIVEGAPGVDVAMP